MATGTKPSMSPKNGSTVAVSAMGNTMLAQYYGQDTRVSAGVQLSTGTHNGLQHRLADGRAGDMQDYEDAAYIRRVLFNQ
jgi:hypothetical protein